MEPTLLGKVILLTGATQGVGRALALGLAGHGADLAIAARTRVDLEALAAELRGMGRDVLPLAADVSARAEVEAMAGEALAHFGRIDVLVNNAGVQGAAGPVWEVDPDAWRRTVEVYLFGTFLCCRAVLPGLIARRRG